ncbi:hypothetical protein PWG14_07940, partial (plasmid) [Chromobacterium amazonense]|uniref:hypothetical protein n=1 Tax=Chromobacterium amazonense TaxID=1382803 RepID=UPI00237E667E
LPRDGLARLRAAVAGHAGGQQAAVFQCQPRAGVGTAESDLQHPRLRAWPGDAGRSSALTSLCGMLLVCQLPAERREQNLGTSASRMARRRKAGSG